MSQICYETNFKGYFATVQIGWDEMCQRFYMVIGPDMEKPIYSNLDDENCDDTLEYFFSVLKEGGGVIPKGLKETLLHHRDNPDDEGYFHPDLDAWLDEQAY